MRNLLFAILLSSPVIAHSEPIERNEKIFPHISTFSNKQTSDSGTTVNQKLPFIQFGYLFGPDLVKLRVDKQDIIGKSFSETSTTLGFHFGFLTRFNLSRHFYLLPQVSLSFQTNHVYYDNGTISVKEDFAPLTLEVPIHIVYKILPGRKFTPAFHLGARYIADVSKKRESILTVKPGTWAAEAGAGFEFKIGKKITLMPQFGVSLSLDNLIEQANTGGIDGVIQSIGRQKFELRFLFF